MNTMDSKNNTKIHHNLNIPFKYIKNKNLLLPIMTYIHKNPNLIEYKKKWKEKLPLKMKKIIFNNT